MQGYMGVTLFVLSLIVFTMVGKEVPLHSFNFVGGLMMGMGISHIALFLSKVD